MRFRTAFKIRTSTEIIVHSCKSCGSGVCKYWIGSGMDFIIVDRNIGSEFKQIPLIVKFLHHLNHITLHPHRLQPFVNLKTLDVSP
jgi:hypothetical protein